MANLNIPSSSQDHIHQTTTPQEIGVLQLDKELLFNAKELRETENYPRARFLNPEAETGKDLEQRNANAKDAFIKRFLEKFSGATLTFLNHPDFKITFDTITFDTNYNAYTVHFTSYMLHQRARFTMEKNTLHQE